LVESGVIEQTGYLSTEISSTHLDLSDQDNIISWRHFEGTYTDVVIGAMVAWGNGASEDSCGFIFGDASSDDSYIFQIDQTGHFSLLHYDFGQDTYLELDFGNTIVNSGSSRSNDLVMVVRGNSLQVFVNRQASVRLQSESLGSVPVGVSATTGSNSDVTGCTFMDLWLWDLEATEPPPKVLPTLTSIAKAPIVAGTYQGVVPLGGGETWLYAGMAGEVLTVHVNAESPAGPDTATNEQLKGGMLDSILVIRAPDGSVIAVNDDDANALSRTDNSTNSAIYNLQLPVDGTYEIEVRSYGNESTGAYTLIIERMVQGLPTPQAESTNLNITRTNRN
jgi:hypothetical protein